MRKSNALYICFAILVFAILCSAIDRLNEWHFKNMLRPEVQKAVDQRLHQIMNEAIEEGVKNANS